MPCSSLINRLLFCTVLVIPALAFADFSGKVVGVSDGDTIRVLHDGVAERVRLNGIDCPEKSQPYGHAAKQFTSVRVFDQEVTVQAISKDKYGRTIGDVTLPDGANLNRELVRAGLAWWYREYSKDVSLGDLENEARLARQGLWAEPHPLPPWEFRKLEQPKRNTEAALLESKWLIGPLVGLLMVWLMVRHVRWRLRSFIGFLDDVRRWKHGLKKGVPR